MWKTHCVMLKVIVATHYIMIKLNKHLACFPIVLLDVIL